MKNEEHTVTLFDSELGPFMEAMDKYTELVREVVSSDDIGKSIDDSLDRHAEVRTEIMVAASRVYYALRKQLERKKETK